MTVNLTKYGDSLLSAWKEVVDDKSPTNWVLLGYEKQTNDLKVINKGDGGLEELVDDLNSGKIMYAFCRVVDPNTGLPKFVFVNWQGEGAPHTRKGSCANHVNDIANLFKAHVTVNARTEDDVDPRLILDKVAKSTASKFNFKDRSDLVENTAPVGSVYKRIQPTKEIDHSEREKFWMKEQEEEKKRVEQERRKAEEANMKLEQERKDREVRETQARDELVRERIRSISKMREAEQNVENANRTAVFEKQQWEKQLQDDAREEQDRRNRSETLRRERSHEAQVLISSRTINARAVFEQNTCAGQMSSAQGFTSLQGEAHDPRREFLQNICPSEVTAAVTVERILPQASSDVSVPKQEMTLEENMTLCRATPIKQENLASQFVHRQFEYSGSVMKEDIPLHPKAEPCNPEEEQIWDDPILEAHSVLKESVPEMKTDHDVGKTQSPENSPQIIMSSSGQNLRARALYDYQAADETEISFDPDDIISHIEQIDEGWWQGMAPDGSYGLFPANYVELLD